MTKSEGKTSKQHYRSSLLPIDSSFAEKPPLTIQATLKKTRKRPISEMERTAITELCAKTKADMTAKVTVIDVDSFLTPVSGKKVSEVTREVLSYAGKEQLA